MVENTKWYSSYFGMFQGSMYGKSRLMIEYAKNNYAVYCCLRPNGSSGYPFQTPQISRFLKSSDMIDHVAFFAAVYNLFAEFKKEKNATPETWLKRHVNLTNSEEEEAKVNGFWRTLINLASQYKSQLNMPSSSTPPPPPMSGFLVVFVDEARELLVENDTLFRLIRRTITDPLRRNKDTTPSALYPPIFCVFADTFSKLSKFSPSNNSDPSLRGRSKDLFNPFYLLDTIDVLAENADVKNAYAAIDDEFIKNTSPSVLFYLGRPSWGSLLHSFRLHTKMLFNWQWQSMFVIPMGSIWNPKNKQQQFLVPDYAFA